MSEEVKDKTKDEKETAKKGLFSESKIEMIVAIFLGITALLTAWATWIGSLHGGNQSTNYTKSNNIASEGNSEYNSGLQTYLSDLMAWNEMMNYYFDIEIANLNGRDDEAELIQEKLDAYVEQNCSDILAEGLDWIAQEGNGAESPFEMPGLVDKYFETANDLLAESQELLEQGQRDNANGDKYGLVTVIYSLVLFMLGIIGVFKKLPNRKIVLLISIIGLVLATIYMLTIPMPTDFSLTSYFKS
jgi:multisubunit Na+/H+ antiporter MnhB subunit